MQPNGAGKKQHEVWVLMLTDLILTDTGIAPGSEQTTHDFLMFTNHLW